MQSLKCGDFILVIEDKNERTRYLTKEGTVDTDETNACILGSLSEAVEKMKELCPKDLSQEETPLIYRVEEINSEGSWVYCEIYNQDGTKKKILLPSE